MDIKLLELTIEDIELVRNWRNSDEVSKFMYTSDKITIKQQENWFHKIKNDPTQKYWIIEYDGAKLGLVSLYNIKVIFKHCSWAFYLGNTEVRGAGIGSKVEYNVLHYVFEILKLNKLCCEVFSFNEKVIEMHKKFGFKQEGYFHQHIYKNNEFHDVVALALLKNEWLAIKNQLNDKIYNRI